MGLPNLTVEAAAAPFSQVQPVVLGGAGLGALFLPLAQWGGSLPVSFPLCFFLCVEMSILLHNLTVCRYAELVHVKEKHLLSLSSAIPRCPWSRGLQ